MKDCKARSGADGNDRLLKSYGGHSTGVARYPYANGGAVTGKSAPAYAKGGMVDMEGGSAAPRLDRPGRMKTSKKGDKGKKGTNVNVVVMAGGKPEGAAPPMAPPPEAGPPMPPPPMRAMGGKVEKHDDEAQDKKLISKMLKKHDEVKMRKNGGAVKMKYGAGSGEGRLEQEEKYSKKHFSAGGMVKSELADDDGNESEKAGWIDKGASAAMKWLKSPSKRQIDEAHRALEKFTPKPREVPKMSNEDAIKYFEKDGTEGGKAAADLIRKHNK